MEELFDLCTPEGEPTGLTVPRSRAHREGLWHRSAHLWLTDGAGRLLLQRRHPAKETDPGRWDIAAAGHLSAGQTPREAVVREAREELGLVLDPGSLTFLRAVPRQYAGGRFIDREWQHLFAGVWKGELSALVLQSDEVVDVRWMAVDEYRGRQEAGDQDYVGRREDWPDFEAWLNRG